MPEISRFYGLIILMNFKDHNPPHFHVWYGDFKAIVTIDDGIVKGEMPFFIGYIAVFIAVVLFPILSTFLVK